MGYLIDKKNKVLLKFNHNFNVEKLINFLNIIEGINFEHTTELSKDDSVHFGIFDQNDDYIVFLYDYMDYDYFEHNDFIFFLDEELYKQFCIMWKSTLYYEYNFSSYKELLEETLLKSILK